jgi:hypothetical protein
MPVIGGYKKKSYFHSHSHSFSLPLILTPTQPFQRCWSQSQTFIVKKNKKWKESKLYIKVVGIAIVNIIKNNNNDTPSQQTIPTHNGYLQSRRHLLQPHSRLRHCRQTDTRKEYVSVCHTVPPGGQSLIYAIRKTSKIWN